MWVPGPFPDPLSTRLALIVAGMCDAIGQYCCRNRAVAPMLGPLGTRLLRLLTQFSQLVAKVQEGRLPAPDAGRRRAPRPPLAPAAMPEGPEAEEPQRRVAGMGQHQVYQPEPEEVEGQDRESRMIPGPAAGAEPPSRGQHAEDEARHEGG